MNFQDLRAYMGVEMARSMTRRDALLGGAMLCSSAGLPARSAGARDWPTHNIKLIVGAAAGSVPDSLARLAGDALSKKLGQPIVIENRASAGGIVAMRDLITSAPDGYTIALATLSQAVFNSYLFSKLPYEPLRDLAPISTLAASSFVLAVHPSVQTTTLDEIIALSRRQPGKLLIGVPPNGSPPHIAAILFLQVTGLSANLVPFGSGPAALTATMRGDVQLFMDGPSIIAPQVNDRALRALVVTSSRRQDTLPEVPTLAEAGFPKAEMESWMGLVAPRRTPEEVIARLSLESRAILETDDYTRKLRTLGFLPRSASPAEFAALIEQEHRRWSEVLRTAGVKLD